MTDAGLNAVREPRRLAALQRLHLLDSPAEAAFDRLAGLAARILHTPVALVSLVDRDRQFFKSCLGLPEPWSSWRQTPLSHSFCQHVVATAAPLVVADARLDPRLRDNPAIRDLGVIAYLGIPLILPGGEAIGSFCVIDTAPRAWGTEEVSVVRDLAASVMTEIELRSLRAELAQRLRNQESALAAAGEETRAREERYRDLVESSLDLICTHDLDGRLLGVNRRASDLTGYAPEELVGKNLRALIAPEFRSQFDEYLRRIRREGQASGLMQIATRAGERRVWEFRNTLRTAGVPEPVVRGTAHDVTRQVESERRLRASESLFRELIELAADGIFISDPDGRLIIVNEAGSRLSGYTQDELLALSLVDLIPAEDRLSDPPRLDELRAGKTVLRQRRLLRKDGTIVPVEVNVKQLPGGRFQGIVRDITERKLAESEREKLVAELTARNMEMENFVYTISHDLKTPLITIGGFAGLAAKSLERADLAAARDSLQEINRAVEQMQGHIRDLLLLSRTGRVAEDKRPLPLAELVAEALRAFTPRIAELEAKVNVAADLPTITADRKGFLRVFTNLIDNALKYRRLGAAPRVEIGWQRHGEELRLYVRDNGIGIKPEYRQRIFGLFQRADSTTEGTGVGLAIARRVVEVHGGRMWFESEPDRGSTFWIGLPVTAIAGAPPEPA